METTNAPRFWNALPILFMLLIFILIAVTTCRGQSGIFAEARTGLSTKFHSDFEDDYPRLAYEYGIGVFAKTKQATLRTSLHFQNHSSAYEQDKSITQTSFIGSKTTFEFYELFVSLGAYSPMTKELSDQRIEVAFGYRHSFGKVKLDLQYAQALTKIYKSQMFDQGKMNALTFGIIREL